MDIINSKNINSGNLESRGGNIHLGDNYFNILEYKNILERIEELEEFINSTQNKELKSKFIKKLNEAKSQLENFKTEIFQLVKIFQTIDLDTPKLKDSKKYFDLGKLEKVKEVLDEKELSKELEVLLNNKKDLTIEEKRIEESLRHKADEFLILAKLSSINYELKNRYNKTVELYEKSLQAERNSENLFSYGHFLAIHHQTQSSIDIFEELLEVAKKQTTENPESHLSNISSALNSLGILYNDKKEYIKSEDFYKEALKINRLLIKDDYKMYLPDVALVLNNLGNLYKEKHELILANNCHEEALTIRRELVAQKPKEYLPDLALTLNNYGALLIRMCEFKKSEEYLNESLKIRNELLDSEKKSDENISNIASSLHNLGYLFKNKKEYEKAEGFFRDAINLLNGLIEKNPQRYLPKIISCLNNLGTVKMELEVLNEAEDIYLKSLELNKTYRIDIEEGFLEDLGHSLNNLGLINYRNKKFGSSERYYLESLEVKRKLAKLNPQGYLSDLGLTLINFGALLNDLGVQLKEKKKLSIAKKCFQEAIDINQLLDKNVKKKYRVKLAMAHHNLGTLYRDEKKILQSENSYLKALKIRQNLSKENPHYFLPEVAITLKDLANLSYYEKKDLVKSEEFYREVVNLYKKLNDDGLNKYQVKLANTYVYLALLYWNGFSSNSLAKMSASNAIELYSKNENLNEHAISLKKTAESFLGI